MSANPISIRRLKHFSLRSQQDEPDTRQMDYEDMFTAVVPQSERRPERRKPTVKGRRSGQPPSLSSQDYLDQLVFYSRTKPLPPLPESERPPKVARSTADKGSEESSWSVAVRRWKHQFKGAQISARCITPEIVSR